MRLTSISGMALAAMTTLASAGSASPIELRVTVTNNSPSNSLSFAPFRLAFNSGIYDAFNNGQVATSPIVSIAEGGSGSAWFPAFSMADPTATLGTVGGGPLLPGATASSTFMVDPAVNQYFTFGAMVIPSNDYFLGNDSPTQFRLFNNAGNLLINEIGQFGRDIWDAGSETDGIFGAAFLPGSTNDDRIPQNGVVNFDFQGLDVFNGATTAAGYVFQRQIGADSRVYTIQFEVVPAPGVGAAFALLGVVASRRRRS